MTDWPDWLLWLALWVTLAGTLLLCVGLLYLIGRAESRRDWVGLLWQLLCVLGLLPVLPALLFVYDALLEIMRRMRV